MPTQTRLWRSLQLVPGLCALPVIWRRLLGEEFTPFKAFLQSRPDHQVRFFPCPNGCPSWHEVYRHAPEDIVAVCRCEASQCPDLVLRPVDLVPLELSWPKLARAVCQALGLAGKLAGVGLPYTRQIGAWAGGTVPAFLTIQNSPGKLRSVIESLVGRWRQPFLLLVPTLGQMEAGMLESLANIGAGCLSLDAHLRLATEGKLVCNQAPGELLAKFSTPATEPVPEDQARAAFSLVRRLDSELTARKASLYTVFRLYCMEGLSPEQIAKKCRCARSLIYSRLAQLRQKLGRPPAELREYSGHFERIEEDLSDSRARRIYRKGAVYGEEDDPEGGE